jgi:hypothetical protein
LVLHAQMKGMDLGALLAAVGAWREVRGGKTDGRIDIGATGITPRQWESTMSGTVIALVGPATLVNTKVDMNSPLNKLGATVNPFHNVDPSTELQCAVIRCPCTTASPKSSGASPSKPKFGATASGKLDFRTQTLDLAIDRNSGRVSRWTSAGCRSGSFPRAVRFTRGRDRFGGHRGHHRPHRRSAYTGGLSIVGESLLSRPAAIPAKSRSAGHRARGADGRWRCRHGRRRSGQGAGPRLPSLTRAPQPALRFSRFRLQAGIASSGVSSKPIAVFATCSVS